MLASEGEKTHIAARLRNRLRAKCVPGQRADCCVPLCLLSVEALVSADFPSADCALFCKLLGEARSDGVPSRHFRGLWDCKKKSTY